MSAKPRPPSVRGPGGALALLVTIAALPACKPKSLPGTEGIELAPSASGTTAPAAKDFAGHVVTWTKAKGFALDGTSLVAPGFDPSRASAASPADGGVNAALDSLANEVRRSGRPVIVAVERTTPYRIVADVVLALGRGGATNVDFLVQSGAERHLRSIAIPLGPDATCIDRSARKFEELANALSAAMSDAGIAPSPGSAMVQELSQRDALCLGVVVGQDGRVTFSAGSDRLAPSCEEFREGAFLAPRGAHDVDTDGVARCLTYLGSRARPPLERTMTSVAADAEAPFESVIAVLDVLARTNARVVLGTAR